MSCNYSLETTINRTTDYINYNTFVEDNICEKLPAGCWIPRHITLLLLAVEITPTWVHGEVLTVAAAVFSARDGDAWRRRVTMPSIGGLQPCRVSLPPV